MQFIGRKIIRIKSPLVAIKRDIYYVYFSVEISSKIVQIDVEFLLNL